MPLPVIPRAPATATAFASRRVPAAFAVVAANVAVVATVVTNRESGLLLLAALPAALLAGTLAFAIWSRPQRGVLLLAALLPFDGLQAIIGFPAGWKEGLVLITLAATFVAPAPARATPGRVLPSWAYVTAGLVALGAVSALLVGGTRGTVGLKVGYFFVLAAVIVWRCPLDARERDRLVTILMATGLVTAVFGIVQQVLGPERLVELGWDYNANVRFAGGFLRSFSTFDVNFPFALFLMLVVLVGVPSALEDVRRPRNRLFLYSLPVVALALASTVTRAPWLGLAVGLAYVGVTRYRPVLVSLVHALAIGTVALLLLGGYTSTFLSASSTWERFDIWSQNVSEIAEHPLGAGIGATGSAAEKALEVEGTDRAADATDVVQPDNSYFKTTFDLGVIGLWLFVMLLVTAFTGAHGAARRLTGSDAALASSVAALVLAAAFISFVATFFEVFPLDAYFWLLLGVVAACAPESR